MYEGLSAELLDLIILCVKMMLKIEVSMQMKKLFDAFPQ